MKPIEQIPAVEAMPMFIRPVDGNYEAGVGGVKGTINQVVNL